MSKPGVDINVALWADPFMGGLVSGALDGHDGVELVSVGSDMQEVFSALEEKGTDVLLLAASLDLSPPGDGQPGVLESIRSAHPSVGILLVDLRCASPSRAWSLMRQGAIGYVCLSDHLDQLGHALREVADGRPYLNPALGAQIASMDDVPSRRVSPREAEVLRLVAFGFTNSQIADRLGLSVRTVEAHRASLNSKLGFTSRAELVRYALDQGIIS